MLSRLRGPLERLPRTAVFLIGLGLLALVWYADRVAPEQLGLSVFYLIPIVVVGWSARGRLAYLMSFLAACAWLNNDLATGADYSHWALPYWNAGVRLGFFLIVTFLSTVVNRLRRLNDLEQEAARTAREASELKTGMMSLVSHEFGNSLTGLQLAMELIKESQETKSLEPLGRASKTLQRLFAHLKTTTNSFLSLDRLEAGQFRPEFRKTPVGPLVREVLALLEPLIEYRHVRMKVDLAADCSPVRVDPNALALIMSNLIGNAVKYTPEGGAVTVRVVPREDGALLSVEDTGIGIAPADQERIFAGFYRSEEGQRSASGYGVGLRASQELLAVQGSKLEVESAPGKGSRFFFTLPKWTGPHSAEPAAATRS